MSVDLCLGLVIGIVFMFIMNAILVYKHFGHCDHAGCTYPLCKCSCHQRFDRMRTK